MKLNGMKTERMYTLFVSLLVPIVFCLQLFLLCGCTQTREAFRCKCECENVTLECISNEQELIIQGR